jgi:hypothetical protein
MLTRLFVIDGVDRPVSPRRVLQRLSSGELSCFPSRREFSATGPVRCSNIAVADNGSWFMPRRAAEVKTTS